MRSTLVEELRIKSWVSQIGRSVVNGSSSLQNFSDRSCVARAQWRRVGFRQLFTRFSVIQQFRFDLYV